MSKFRHLALNDSPCVCDECNPEPIDDHDCDDGEKCEPCPRCYKERGLTDSCVYACGHEDKHLWPLVLRSIDPPAEGD